MTTTETSTPACARYGAVADRTYRFLVRHGFRPVHMSRGEQFPQLRFDAGGLTFRIQLDELDDDFWQVVLGFRLAPPRRPDLDVLRALHDAQAWLKFVKIRVSPGQETVEFLAPVLLQGRRPTRDLLQRCMGHLRQVADEFHERLLLLHPQGRA